MLLNINTMNNKILFLASLIFSSLLILQSGCKKEKDEEPEPQTASFTDTRDGQVYNIVTIGSQTWFAENLNYEAPNSYWYDYSYTNGDIYGRLYAWGVALTVCPSGWHLPSDDEWCTLTTYIDTSVNCNVYGGSGKDVGYKMKSIDWWYQNGNGSDAYGFKALPGGHRYINGNFYQMGKYAFLWAYTESRSDNAISRSIYYLNDEVCRNNDDKANGFSVRCVKD